MKWRVSEANATCQASEAKATYQNRRKNGKIGYVAKVTKLAVVSFHDL
jgi:hypothetical protein